MGERLEMLAIPVTNEDLKGGRQRRSVVHFLSHMQPIHQHTHTSMHAFIRRRAGSQWK